MTGGPAIKLSGRVLRAWPLPDPWATQGKQDRGTVLVVGGSREIPGAVLLAGVAALRAGAGKLQVATADAAARLLAVALPEARVMSLRTAASGELTRLSAPLREAISRADAIVLGPGMDASGATTRFARRLIAASSGLIVVDAGALEATLARKGKATLVATPHAGEMASLLGIEVSQVEAQAATLARRMATHYGITWILKGATTYIAAPDGRLWINMDGGPGLGTSGSGDVLSGLIAGLAARGAAPEQAAAWAVYLHARAGSVLARRQGTLGFLAREISAEVPRLMRDLAPFG
jgi:hydroxyethylthiazole kinase-like uncharacterized protein yjeF